LPVLGMDVVEVSPPFDHADVTALLGNRVVLEALSAIARRRKDDRDDFCFKAVETTGMLMALLFRRHFRAFKDKLARQ